MDNVGRMLAAEDIACAGGQARGLIHGEQTGVGGLLRAGVLRQKTRDARRGGQRAVTKFGHSVKRMFGTRRRRRCGGRRWRRGEQKGERLMGQGFAGCQGRARAPGRLPQAGARLYNRSLIEAATGRVRGFI